jgi:hypothetical protein
MASVLGVLGVVANVARKAIKWLGIAGNWVSDHEDQLKILGSILAQNKHLTKYVGKFFELMQKAEATVGAHTHAWSTIEQAAKNNQGGSNLTAADIKYLYEFKKIFDKTIKRLGTDKKLQKSSKVLKAKTAEINVKPTSYATSFKVTTKVPKKD